MATAKEAITNPVFLVVHNDLLQCNQARRLLRSGFVNLSRKKHVSSGSDGLWNLQLDGPLTQKYLRRAYPEARSR